MIGVLLTFRYGEEFDEQAVRKFAETARGRFGGMPGLRSKAFMIDSETREDLREDPHLMAPQTPYTPDLGDRDPIAAMNETPERIRAVTSGWTSEQFERTYAPGKWTARLILIHLAQTELALGTRARMALSTPAYAAQNFDQDAWLGIESGLSGREAATALVAVGRMNAALFRSLSADARQTSLSHPAYGTLTVDWIIHQMAGHQIHHLKQLEAVR